jgi:hypothetical protein
MGTNLTQSWVDKYLFLGILPRVRRKNTSI